MLSCFFVEHSKSAWKKDGAFGAKLGRDDQWVKALETESKWYFYENYIQHWLAKCWTAWISLLIFRILICLLNASEPVGKRKIQSSFSAFGAFILLHSVPWSAKAFNENIQWGENWVRPHQKRLIETSKNFHLQLCCWPSGCIRSDLCDLQVAEIHANLQVWDLSVNLTIHFERITKLDFFDESKKRCRIFFWTASTYVLHQCLSLESPPQIWCKRSTPGLALRKMSPVFATHENLSLHRQRSMTWRVEAPAVKRGTSAWSHGQNWWEKLYINYKKPSQTLHDAYKNAYTMHTGHSSFDSYMNYSLLYYIYIWLYDLDMIYRNIWRVEFVFHRRKSLKSPSHQVIVCNGTGEASRGASSCFKGGACYNPPFHDVPLNLAGIALAT